MASLDLETLLRTDPPSTPRATYVYYNKQQEIPIVGDVIRLRSTADYEYLLITEVVLGTREEMYYRGYRVDANNLSGIPQSRHDLTLPAVPIRKKFYPKKRRDVTIDVMRLTPY